MSLGEHVVRALFGTTFILAVAPGLSLPRFLIASFSLSFVLSMVAAA